MRKFNSLYKDKLDQALNEHETKVLGDFRQVYDILLENYNTISINDLNKETQTALLGELNRYWNETDGLTDKGRLFLNKKAMTLTESSTVSQKKNYLKSKIKSTISEALRQTDLKYRIYDIVDYMYKETNSQTISDVLTPNKINGVLTESFNEIISDFLGNISTELNESEKENTSRARSLNENEKYLTDKYFANLIEKVWEHGADADFDTKAELIENFEDEPISALVDYLEDLIETGPRYKD